MLDFSEVTDLMHGFATFRRATTPGSRVDRLTLGWHGEGYRVGF